MPTRPDVRLETAPMEPLTCNACAATVEVRKSSWDQTSIQWHQDAMQACLERRATTPGTGANGNAFAGCSALRASIREAAVAGTVHVVSGEPLKTNPDAPHSPDFPEAPEAEQTQVNSA